ncbi:hypothetical protein G9P44_002784 [Scheffersomyces stipitis]|nr:hypothetical protein G9P44_002784 [Scheffersomyces stipitis]
MRLHCILLATFAVNELANAAAISPIGMNNSIADSTSELLPTTLLGEVGVSSNDLDSEVHMAGLLGWVKNGKTKTINFVKILKEVLANIKRVEEIKKGENKKNEKEKEPAKDDLDKEEENGDEEDDDGEDNEEEDDDEEGKRETKKGLVNKLKGWFGKGSSLVKRDLVEDLLVKVFVSLKRSGLINSIIKMSLTDDEVREGVVDIAADLLERDVIPFEDIFVALKDSGLAVDVIKFSLTDEETRGGVVALIRELLPHLIADGSINPKDLIATPPKVYRRDANTKTYSYQLMEK